MPVHVACVVGTRPNFVKTAPVLAELRRRPGFAATLIHTGQHYDDAMSRIFLEDLGVGAVDHMLDVGSGSHSVQTARVIERLEPILAEERPDVVLVPGDVNSTLAAAIVAAKLGIPIAHLEAGLRSFDNSMPEEINRVVTDRLSSLLLTHSPEARDNLLREGIEPGQIHAVGNTMIDTLVAMGDRIDAADMVRRHNLNPGEYLVVTLHRPALVDGPLLAEALRYLEGVARQLTVIFPCHPRTMARLSAARLPDPDLVRIVEPMGYIEFMSLVRTAKAVLTDSGGIQEETTFMGIPCFTLRSNTERPVTCSIGTNVLLGLLPERIREVPALLAQTRRTPRSIPDGWDGRAAERVVDAIAAEFEAHRCTRSISAAVASR